MTSDTEFEAALLERLYVLYCVSRVLLCVCQEVSPGSGVVAWETVPGPGQSQE